MTLYHKEMTHHLKELNTKEASNLIASLGLSNPPPAIDVVGIMVIKLMS